jgi:hypothetical protein
MVLQPVRLVLIIVTASMLSGPKADSLVRWEQRGSPPLTDRVPTDCVRFESPGKLAAGTPYRATLLRGLEFRLSADWNISIGPLEDATDYLWVASPPLRTAPHRMIGAGYGLTARQSARIERPLRFVLTRADYEAARVAIDLESATDSLKRLEQLGRGRLSFAITDFRIRDVTLHDGRQSDAFEWITFRGEACVPRQEAG